MASQSKAEFFIKMHTPQVDGLSSRCLENKECLKNKIEKSLKTHKISLIISLSFWYHFFTFFPKYLKNNLRISCVTILYPVFFT